MKRRLLPLTLLVALVVTTALATTACSSKAAAPASPAASQPKSHTGFLDKTRFLTDMGLGAYAAYHWVYQPWQSGMFTSGSTKVLIGRYAKAAIALGFAYNRFKAAYKIASKSNDKVLRALAAPLNKLNNHFNQEQTQLSHGHYNANDMNSMYNETTKYYALTHTSGYNITQIPSRVPGVS